MITPEQIRTIVERYHTPVYIFDEAIIRRQCRALKAAITYPNTVIRFACKALTLGAVLRIIRSEGLQIDAVSINEVHRALRAGFKPSEILYTGEGASRLVYEELLDRGVLINCSAIDQLRLIAEIRKGSPCSIRVNPGEGHGANTKVNTGGPASKHGIYFDQLAEVKAVIDSGNLDLRGIHSHIGSGAELDHWLRIKDLTFDIAREFPNLRFIDLGGGLPIVYNPETDPPMPLEAWGRELTSAMQRFSREYGRELQLQIEPGRYVVAECGLLVAEVQTIKRTPSYKFIIVNTGLNHNPRPAMYGSYHPIHFISKDGSALTGSEPAVIGGYLCESGDVFTVQAGGELAPRPFPDVRLGDYMVMGHVGAYSHPMKSEYNSMNLPPSVLVEESGTIRLIERRGTLDDIVRREVEVYEEGSD